MCAGACVPWWRSGLLCVSLHLPHCLIQSPLLSSASYTRLAGPQTVGDSPVSASHLAVRALGLQAHTSTPGSVGPYPLSRHPSLSLFFQNTWYGLEEPNLCGLPKAADGNAPWCSQKRRQSVGFIVWSWVTEKWRSQCSEINAVKTLGSCWRFYILGAVVSRVGIWIEKWSHCNWLLTEFWAGLGAPDRQPLWRRCRWPYLTHLEWSLRDSECYAVTQSAGGRSELRPACVLLMT